MIHYNHVQRSTCVLKSISFIIHMKLLTFTEWDKRQNVRPFMKSERFLLSFIEVSDRYAQSEIINPAANSRLGLHLSFYHCILLVMGSKTKLICLDPDIILRIILHTVQVIVTLFVLWFRGWNYGWKVNPFKRQKSLADLWDTIRNPVLLFRLWTELD